jgi:polyisoprenoid-binding protein YceI
MRRFCIFPFILAAAGLWAADTYTVDPAHSHVGFKVTHMVISKVSGQFTSFSGTFIYDEQDITKSSLRGKIETAGINTQNEARDKHLKSPDFLDAEKNPEITFESKAFVKSGDGWRVVGTLTLRGVSKEVSFPFTITGKVKDPYGNERIGAEAALTINRMEYGLSWNKTLDTGGLVVGNDVMIDLSAEFIKQKPPAPQPAGK